MAGPRHALTLRSKGQRSNPNPRVRVWSLWCGWVGIRPACACMSIRLHISLVLLVFVVVTEFLHVSQLI